MTKYKNHNSDGIRDIFMKFDTSSMHKSAFFMQIFFKQSPHHVISNLTSNSKNKNILKIIISTPRHKSPKRYVLLN